MHTVKPLDEEEIASALGQAAVIATIEEHSVHGGLSTAVAEVVAREGAWRGKLLSFGLDPNPTRDGSDLIWHGRQSLDPKRLAGQIEAALKGGLAYAI